MYLFFSKINKIINNFFFFILRNKKSKKKFQTIIKKHLIKKEDWNIVNKHKISNEYFLEKKIKFSNLYCDPITGYFFSKFGNPYISEHHFSKKYMDIKYNFFLPLFKNKKKVKKGVFFGGHFMENYCHFLFYIYVPILILPKNYTLVFDSRLLNKKFFKEFLNIIKKERDYLLIDKPTLFEKGLIYQKKYLAKKELNVVKKNIKKIKNRTYKIIYIQRQSNFRNINNDNEIEIISILKKKFKNIRIINCEKLSFRKQIEIFSNANILIGAHGADFANMIFGLKNIKKIIEFCHPSFFTGVYPRLSRLYKIKHFQIIGTNSGNNKEFSINLDELKKII